VYDIWFHPASYNEVKSFRLRKSKSKWFRFLVETFESFQLHQQVEEGYNPFGLPLWICYGL